MNDETSSSRHSILNNTPKSLSFRDGAVRDRQPEPKRKLQVLYVGSLVLGVFEDEIATIAEWRRPTPLPHAPPPVLGVVSIQGRMLTVLDPLHLFSETTTRLGFATGILVALRGDEQIALAIDHTGETLDLTMNDIQPAPDPANRAVAGIFHYGDQLVNVIQVKGLFPAALRGRERRRRRF
jgi:purine-binding chemotaxis protein CheW